MSRFSTLTEEEWRDDQIGTFIADKIVTNPVKKGSLISHMKLFDRTISLLSRSLDLRTSGQRVLASNIANAETPNFHSKSIPFQKILERSVDHASNIQLIKTHPDHLSEDIERTLEVESSMEGVNIDQEMAKLAENNLMFQAGIQALVKKLESLKTTILEGGR